MGQRDTKSVGFPAVNIRSVSLSVGTVGMALGASVNAQAAAQTLAPVGLVPAGLVPAGSVPAESVLTESEVIEGALVASELTTHQAQLDGRTRLQTLQAGARRAQLDRVQRAQALTSNVEYAATRTHDIGHSDTSHSNISDGVYLYGERAAYDQLATAYFVFQANAGDVTGAFYTASSSFDCAQGRINSDGMELTITESYSQESYPYSLGLSPIETQIASQHAQPVPVSIEGFHELPIRESDRAILSICEAKY